MTTFRIQEIRAQRYHYSPVTALETLEECVTEIERLQAEVERLRNQPKVVDNTQKN